MKFLMRKWRNDFKTSRTTDAWYDLFGDWDLIASSLKTQYGYSIRQEINKLSWGELCSDIAGLNGDTPLGNIVRIRSENDPEALKKFTRNELQIRSEWRNRYAKQINQENYKEAMEGFKNMFIALSKNGK